MKKNKLLILIVIGILFCTVSISYAQQIVEGGIKIPIGISVDGEVTSFSSIGVFDLSVSSLLFNSDYIKVGFGANIYSFLFLLNIIYPEAYVEVNLIGNYLQLSQSIGGGLFVFLSPFNFMFELPVFQLHPITITETMLSLCIDRYKIGVGIATLSYMLYPPSSVIFINLSYLF